MRRAVLLLCALAGPASGVARAEEVAGRIELAVADARLGDLGPTVVFLEGSRASGHPGAPPGAAAVIRQRKARFEPGFLVVSAGQTVEMPNDDTIFHNVFSFSRPNDFDLGVYPAGTSRSVTLEHSGLVRIYCSIHESMSATVLVVPSSHFALASPSGEYRIEGVAPGSYRLTVWNEMLPAATREVRVQPRDGARVDVALAGGEP